MSVIDDGTTSTTEKKAPRARPSRAKRPGHRRAKFTPPNNVNPGWLHNLAAALTVRALSEREIEVGPVNDDMVKLIPGAEDGPSAAELIARIYAHIAWRIPIIRSIAKRLEGTDAKAGPASDLLALGVKLWLQNEDLIAAVRTAQARKVADVVKPSGDDTRRVTPIFTRQRSGGDAGEGKGAA